MKQLKITKFPELDYAGSEAFNTLSTNLSFAGETVKKIMITSCHASEGKSYLSMNLMRTLAQRGMKVALVDADLRRSVVNAQYGLQFEDGRNDDKGLSHFLAGMAGMEEVSNGEARLTPGYTVGILQQEPPLDEDKTVLENIELAFGDVKAKIDRFNEIGGLMAEPDADFDALMEEMGKLQEAIDAANGWDLDSQLSQAMDALQCPDPDMPVNVLSGGERRRVALCKLCLLYTSPSPRD